MAIAFDNSATGHATGTSVTWNHTLGQNNLYVLIGVAQGNNVDDVTSVTVDGNNATQYQLVSPDSTSVSHQYLWGIAMSGPNAAKTVAVNRSASGDIRGISLSYTDSANAISLLNSGQSNSPSNSPDNYNATFSSGSGAWAVSFCGWQRTPTLSTGFTSRQTVDDNAYKSGDSNGTITSPYAFAYTFAGGNAKDDSAVWGVIGLAASAAGSARRRMMAGIGT